MAASEEGLRERQRIIEERLRKDIKVTLVANLGGFDPRVHDVLLDELVGDAMHHIDLLLREKT